MNFSMTERICAPGCSFLIDRILCRKGFVFVLFALTFLLTPMTAWAQVTELPVTGIWNGFLSHINVIECNNLEDQTLDLTVTVSDVSGTTLGNRSLNLPPFSTKHLILNEFPIADSYGTYLLEFKAQTQSDVVRLNCLTAIYRMSSENADNRLEYAYALPINETLKGESSGIYNSMNPDPAGPPVLNWLSVYNPDTSPFSAEVLVYSDDGTIDELRSFTIQNLQPRARYDYPLGHNQTERQNGKTIGLYRIVPEDNSIPYGALVTRYSKLDDEYQFAFPLFSRQPTCDLGPLPASTMDPASNWGEIANPTPDSIIAQIEVIAASGNVVYGEQVSIPPFSQYHIHLNEHLGERSVGSLRVSCLNPPSNTSGLLVQSLFYGQVAANDPRITWAYASQLARVRAQKGALVAVSLNTFLGAANWGKFFEESGQATGLDISIYDQEGTLVALRSERLPSSGSLDLGFHETVGPDVIGLSTVRSSDTAPRYTSELVRVFYDDQGNIDYIMNIPAGVFSEDGSPPQSDFEPERIIYVDDRLSTSCSGSYSIAARNCSGNEGDAFPQIKEATAVAIAGEAIYIREGTYTERDILFTNSGLLGQPIIVSAFPTEERQVIIQGNADPSARGRSIFAFTDITGASPGLGNYIFRGLVLRQANDAFWFGSATARVHDVLIENVEFYNLVSAVTARDMGIERLVIRDSYAHDCNDADGIFNFKTSNQLTVPGSGSRNVIFRNNRINNATQQTTSSSILTQEQGENFILIENEADIAGQYSYTSKSGGHHIWLNNKSYDNGKGGFYLGGPFKIYARGAGPMIKGDPANYLLLNNVVIGRRVITGGSIVNWWRDSNLWLYNNTLLSLREPVQSTAGAAFSSSTMIKNETFDYLTTGFTKNNIFYQAYGYNVGWYTLVYNEPNVLPRQLLSDFNLYYSVGRSASEISYKIFSSLVGGSNLENLNLNFQGWKDWFATNQGAATDQNSLWADPLFDEFDRTVDSGWQNMTVQPNSPVIDTGSPYGTNDSNDYPQMVEQFLEHYSPDQDANSAFEEFSILTTAERAELRNYIRNAYKFDINRNPRDGLPDIGAYETP